MKLYPLVLIQLMQMQGLLKGTSLQMRLKTVDLILKQDLKKMHQRHYMIQFTLN